MRSYARRMAAAHRHIVGLRNIAQDEKDFASRKGQPTEDTITEEERNDVNPPCGCAVPTPWVLRHLDKPWPDDMDMGHLVSRTCFACGRTLSRLKDQVRP